MSGDGAVLGSFDDRDGGSGEQIDVDLDKVDPNICEIVFVVSIHDEGKTFGDVNGAFISVVNAENDEELCGKVVIYTGRIVEKKVIHGFEQRF